jgi:hypothetical protein
MTHSEPAHDNPEGEEPRIGLHITANGSSFYVLWGFPGERFILPKRATLIDLLQS